MDTNEPVISYRNSNEGFLGRVQGEQIYPYTVSNYLSAGFLVASHQRSRKIPDAIRSAE